MWKPTPLENACKLLTYQMMDEGLDRTIALVDFGAATTSFSVLHDRKIIYTYNSDFGGKQLTEEIMRHYGLTYRGSRQGQERRRPARQLQGGDPRPLRRGHGADREPLAAVLPVLHQRISTSGSDHRVRRLRGHPRRGRTHQREDGHAGRGRQPLRPDEGVLARQDPTGGERGRFTLLVACGLALRSFD